MTQPAAFNQSDLVFFLNDLVVRVPEQDAPDVRYVGEQMIQPVLLVEHQGNVNGLDWYSAALRLRVLNAGSAAKGLQIQHTDTIGNLIEITQVDPYRNKAFVVDDDYHVGINVNYAADVAPMLKVAQDLASGAVGIQVLALDGQSSDLIQALDLNAIKRFYIDNAGQLFEGKNAYFFGDGIQIGSSSSDFGGGVKVVGIDNATTAPTTNPTDGVVLYAETNKLHYRDPDGLIWDWPNGNPTSKLHNMVTWAYDPVGAINSSKLTEHSLYMVKVLAPRRQLWTNLVLYITVVPVGPTNTYVGVYSTSGTLLLTSADVSASISSTGLKTLPFSTPTALDAGYYYIAFLPGGGPGGGPSVASAGAPGGMGNINLSGATLRFAVNGSGLTTMPSTITPSAATGPGFQFWLGVS